MLKGKNKGKTRLIYRSKINDPQLNDLINNKTILTM